MRRRIRDQRRQQGGVEHQHGAGDAGHAAGHHQKQFAARQLREIGPDEQRRFHHAEKDVGRGGQPDRAADAERAFQQPRHAAHHRRQDFPVEQQRGQHAHDQHHRQRLKRQDEIRARRLQVERQRAAAEIAEHEGGAGARGCGNRADRVVDGAEGVRDERQFCQRHRGEKGDGKADRGLPQRYRAAVLAERPGDAEQREHAERRLQLKHVPHPLGLWQRGASKRNAVSRQRLHAGIDGGAVRRLYIAAAWATAYCRSEHEAMSSLIRSGNLQGTSSAVIEPRITGIARYVRAGDQAAIPGLMAPRR